jgi:hypothetical protein
MNISQITSKNNKKSTSFQTLVILLRSPKVLTSKVHSKDVKIWITTWEVRAYDFYSRAKCEYITKRASEVRVSELCYII